MDESSSRISSRRGELIMFGGKSCVGKTTCAAATALHYASLRQRTLVISTDATPSLSHIFEIKGNKKFARVQELLDINEIGMDAVKEMWDRKFGREVYEVFSSFVSIGYPEFVEFMTSLLPGLSDEFMVDYIRELGGNSTYDSIVWDTAPLGQTLALLQTLAMLRERLRLAPRVYSKLKLGQKSREPILEIIKRWEQLSADNMDFLRNKVGFTMVSISEALAVNQLEQVMGELRKYRITLHNLIINNVVKAEGSSFLLTKAGHQKRYIDIIYDR